MLLEDLDEDAPAEMREALERIRVEGRAILEAIQESLVDKTDAGAGVERLRERMREPLERIVKDVGRLAAGDMGAAARLGDVLRIGAASAELIDFAWNEKKPVQKTAAEPIAARDSAPALTGDVLVVDDNAINRDLLTRLLERQGFQVWPVADGEAALSQVARQKFDLILLDLMMPGMDGMQVLQTLRNDPRWRDYPVVMLSASDETSRVTRCLEMGAEDYVVKPFDPVLLTARMRSVLERNRLRTAAARRTRELENAYQRLRENESRLQESEERLRLATEAAGVGIWYYYPHENVVLMTPRCKLLFGFESNEAPLTFEQMLEQIHAEDRARADAEIKRVIDGESDYDIEYRVLLPNGGVRWIASRGLAHRIASKSQSRLAGVALDVTERRQAQEAMLQAHKLESIGLLAGGIAHDFNNLLTGIIGSASFVIDTLGDDDPNTDMLRNVVDAGERAADLTRQLLAYAGKGKFTVQTLDLSRIVTDISALLRASIARTVTLEMNLTQPLPHIEGDVTQIQQVLMNLVINASEAISDEGSVSVSTGVATLEEGGREHFVVGEDVSPGTYAYLEVADTGAGMDKEILSKIFEPFFTTKFTGRGLGLAAVFGIVRGHDGALEIHTTPGEGSCFRVYFPASDLEPAAPKPLASLLFVDDEPIVRTMAKTALERAGFFVALADNSNEAVQAIAENPEFSLVVLDLAHSSTDGVDAIQALRRKRRDLRILLSSGLSENEVRSRFPGERIDGVLQKPYSASTLVRFVRELTAQGAS
jgi:PAS domain S-box-containing protein